MVDTASAQRYLKTRSSGLGTRLCSITLVDVPQVIRIEVCLLANGNHPTTMVWRTVVGS